LLTDPSRTNVVRRTNQQFMVTFWYPAAPASRAMPGAYVDSQIIPSLDSFYGFSVNPAFVGHALPNASLATNEPSWPVILYSPSANSHRRENVYKVEELASHGFVVVGMDHGDTFDSVFPNGKLIAGQPSRNRPMARCSPPF
jgi:predicted dienelactone hydrolase